MNYSSKQKIPPLKSTKNRIFSAGATSKNYHKIKFCIVSNDKPKSQHMTQKTKLKLMNTNRITCDQLAECCGSPVTWLKKSKPEIFIKQFSGETKNKFTNLCYKQCDIKPIIDEVIVTSSNEIQKTITNNSNSMGHSSKSSKSSKSVEKKNSLLLFKTMSKKIDLDKFLNKTVITKTNFTFIPGEILSENSQSTIYKCLNVTDGNILIAKTYPNPKLKPKYENESKILSLLSHPNIIAYKSNEIINNIPFVFTEYLSGGSIKKIIDIYGKLPDTLIRKYTKEILNGLKYINSLNIIHCDIKCANIFLDGATGTCKIGDFGSAKQLQGKLDKCKGLIGTLPWCAPEVICGEEYGMRCDIWSLGCTVLEMVTGKNPWDEKKIDNYYQCVNIIGKGNDIPAIPEYISESLKKFLLKCLVRKEGDRADVDELLKDEFIIGK